MTGYITYFDEYIHRSDNDIFSEQAQIRLFLCPLNPIMADAVRTQQLKSVEQVKRLAISNATMVGDKIFRSLTNFNSTAFNSANNNTTNKNTAFTNDKNKCLYCQKLGHSISECRLNDFEGSNGFRIGAFTNLAFKVSKASCCIDVHYTVFWLAKTLRGAAILEESLMNRLYQPINPKNF